MSVEIESTSASNRWLTHESPAWSRIVAELSDTDDGDFDGFDEEDFDDDFDDDFEEELEDEYDVENDEFPEDEFGTGDESQLGIGEGEFEDDDEEGKEGDDEEEEEEEE